MEEVQCVMCHLFPDVQTIGAQAIGEDMFAIAVDQPFRFPAAFTFVLRAFGTLEGLGKALDPDYKFADVARPYALDLLQLQVIAWDRASQSCQTLSCQTYAYGQFCTFIRASR